jgi:Fic-DOC domain mobile mystery protein B
VEVTETGDDGTTPVDQQQIAGLKLPGISTKAELDAAEQSNIIAGVDWALRARAMKYPVLLSVTSILELHRRMFGDVYDWAGTMRQRETTIGVDPRQIGPLLHQLCENAKVWIEKETWSPVEIAVRTHHALVSIHVFPNGNGRHARLLVDILLSRYYKREPLPWGGANLSASGSAHDKYIAAMRQADAGNFRPLMDFATSA